MNKISSAERDIIEESGLFDERWYVENYSDVGHDIAPFDHYIEKGIELGRDPGPGFDYVYYLRSNPDVADLGFNPLIHYICYGRKEGRAPVAAASKSQSVRPSAIGGDAVYQLAVDSGLFDASFYLANNLDVARAGVPALNHYRKFGWKEFRNPSPTVDLSWYTHFYLHGHTSVDPLYHYLTEGCAAGNHTAPARPVSFDPSSSLSELSRPIKRICLFAGYDSDGLIDEYVIEYVAELSKYCDVYYLADCRMQYGELEKLSSITCGAWAHRHGMYDFGSWSILAQKIGWDLIEGYDELLFVNDSSYLMHPLDKTFSVMESRCCAWWGLQATKGMKSTFETQKILSETSIDTIKLCLLDKFEDDTVYDFHIGSYFLAFRKDVILSHKFREFVNTIRPEKNKKLLIRRYEIGLTRLLISCRHDFDTLVDRVYPHQPVFTETAFELIKDGFPVLKRYFLTENHYDVAGLINWTLRIKTSGVFKDLAPYENNLARVSNSEKLHKNLWIGVDEMTPYTPEEMAELDKNTPKYDNWWVFPVCGFNHLLSDNTRALFEYVKDDRSIKKVVLTRSKAVHVDGENVVVLPLMSREGQFYLLRSRQIFLKHGPKRNIVFDLENPSHKFYNLWHGIPLKRIGYASLDQNHKLEGLVGENKRLTSVIAASKVDRLAMASAYWPLTFDDIWVTGLPRHDFITCDFNQLPDELQAQAKKLEQQLAGRKLLLFVPTFRNDQKAGYYQFKKEEVEALQSFLLSHGAVLGVREHMADRTRSYGSQLDGEAFLYLGEDFFPHVEILYRAADVLITDYSSCFIDFLLTKRPVISFAFDFDNYCNEERGFFYDMDWCFPGTIAKDFNTLLQSIEYEVSKDTIENDPLYDFRSRIFLEFNDNGNSRRVYEKIISGYEGSSYSLVYPDSVHNNNSVIFAFDNDTKSRENLFIFDVVDDIRSKGWSCNIREVNKITDELWLNSSVIVISCVKMSDEDYDKCMAFRAAGGMILLDVNEHLFYGYYGQVSLLDVGHEEWIDSRRSFDAYHRVLEISDILLVKTEMFKEHVEAKGFHAAVVRTAVSSALIKRYDKRAPRFSRGGRIRFCYAADTQAHAADFALCRTILRDLVRRRPSVEVHIAGLFASDSIGGEDHENLFVLHPAMSQESWHSFLEGMDINLAPSASMSFSDNKVHQRIIDAAIHRVPTIASPNRAYKELITDGFNGLIADSESEWKQAIGDLIDNISFCSTLGINAYDTIIENNSSRVVADEFLSHITQLK